MDGVPRDSARSTPICERFGGRRIAVNDTSRALALAVLFPPQWYVGWPAFRAMQLMTIGSLPTSIRQAYGVEWRARDERAFRALDGAAPNIAAAAAALAREWRWRGCNPRRLQHFKDRALPSSRQVMRARPRVAEKTLPCRNPTLIGRDHRPKREAPGKESRDPGSRIASREKCQPRDCRSDAV